MPFTAKFSTEVAAYTRWHLIPTVRILFVVDGPIGLDDTIGGAGFNLGKVIDTLKNQDFYSNVRFSITGASRTGTRGKHPAATSKEFTYTGFRFDMPDFNINNYHQVWFFGFDPGNDGSSDDSHISTISGDNPNPLKDLSEINILNTWMDTRQGGVLAIGDHHYLGASLCSKIPRVRKMRRWTNADHVPSRAGSDRHDTNQDKTGLGTIFFNAQSDDMPQHIEVLKKTYAQGLFLLKSIPHPILCGRDGVLDILPDHPHEGEVLGTLYSTGSGGTPVDISAHYPGAAAEFPAALPGHTRPVPQIIALGHPVNNPRLEKNLPSNSALNPSHTNSDRPFGLINVYDGKHAGVGRIVTDSTWHHWFNINLIGLDTVAATAKYKKIQNYYTNVAVWLCNETMLNNIVTTWVWNYLVAEFDPMHFSVHDSIWKLGVSARDVLGRTASQCATYTWIKIFIPDLIRKIELPHQPPCLTCPPVETFEIAVLGGMMKELIPLVEKYRMSERFERLKIDVKEIEAAANEGIGKGYKELLTLLDSSIERTASLYKSAQEDFQEPRHAIENVIGTRSLSIRLEKLIFNTPVLPALLKEGKESFLSIVVSDAFGRLDAEPVRIYLQDVKDTRDYTLALDKVIAKGVFQDGEILRIEIFLNDDSLSERNKIFEATFFGEVDSWLGEHGPDFRALTSQSHVATAVISVTGS